MAWLGVVPIIAGALISSAFGIWDLHQRDVAFNFIPSAMTGFIVSVFQA